MLGKISKTVSSQAVDTIDDIVVAYFTAIIGNNGQMDAQMSIKNMPLYEANMTEVDEDFKEFKKQAFNL